MVRELNNTTSILIGSKSLAPSNSMRVQGPFEGERIRQECIEVSKEYSSVPKRWVCQGDTTYQDDPGARDVEILVRACGSYNIVTCNMGRS